ncbi:hypothetical protein BX600DRAFT_518512 [Xylariales sp. PMI_506]|nr:hypothetical protein BX600DRAFT_518512 [Xylariales sp. PMI_506]
MKRIRETLVRLTSRRSRGLRDDASSTLVNSDRVARSSSSTLSESTSAREKNVLVRVADGRGPTVLYNGIQDGEGDGIDIVFVHGLYGHRIGSWMLGSICWPRDLLGRDVSQARIISWGWAGALGTSLLTDHAENLLVDISNMRKDTTRPIVFVGHGIGGLVIKEALVTAAMSRIYGSHTDLGNVYPRTIGCIFLGTPHARTGNRTLGDLVASTAMLAPRAPTPALLRALKEHDDAFENQHSTFLMVSRDIKVVCIREQMRTMVPVATELLRELDVAGLVKGAMPVIVPKESAAYQAFNVTRDEISANHADLARFPSRDSTGYLQIVAHINKISTAPTKVEVEAQDPRNQEILDALYYDTMTEREAHIEPAFGETCKWILSPDASPYYGFLNSKDPILWISGKAGSGKSTLLKHAWKSEITRQALESGWAKDGELLMACFYMFEGGDRIQKSYEGFLRSVMYQILSERRDLIRIAFPSFFQGPWPPQVLFTSITNLNQGFYSLFAHMSETLRLFVFIDGIDEYRSVERKGHYDKADLDITYPETADGDDEEGDESWGRSKWMLDSQTEISQLLLTMANKDTAKFVVSSRELPVFEQAFADLPRIRVQDHTESAIAQYIEGRLENEAPGLPDTKNLCRELAQRSKGDVLWARLAIDMVVDGTLRTLRSTLNSLPSQLGGLDGLYMRMMENLRPEFQRDACRIFNLVVRSLQPPSLVTLAFAEQGYLHESSGQLRITHDSANPFTAAAIQQLSDNQQRRLAVNGAGLLEAEAGDSSNSIESGQRVVFIHQTTKEWVAREDVWMHLGVPPIDRNEYDFSLLSGCVRHLKSLELLRPAVLSWPNPVFRPDTWLLIANSLRYAERIDADVRDVRLYCQLLDELDMTNQRAWIRALENYRPLYEDPEWYDKRLPALYRKHWAGCEPMEAGKPPKRRSFLALAVQANLIRYVASRLNSLDPQEKAERAQELLAYVVAPKAEGFSACVSLSGDYLDFHHDMPDSRFLSILFNAGADVRPRGYGDEVGTSGGDDAAHRVWVKALKTGRRFFSRGSTTMTHLMETGASARLMQNRERWVAAVKAMLEHGADPRAEVQVTNEENGSTATVVAVDLIRETLAGEPEYAIDVIEMERLMHRRYSIGTAQ